MSQAAPANGVAYMSYQPYNMQTMISALPGQDPNMPPQQPYMPGQPPMYQQVRHGVFYQKLSNCGKRMQIYFPISTFGILPFLLFHSDTYNTKSLVGAIIETSDFIYTNI